MLVTNRARLAERVGATPNDLESVTPHLLSQIESAAAAGVTVIQLREPDLEARALARLTRAAMRVIEGTEVSLVVNGRVDVALAAGAHGASPCRSAGCPPIAYEPCCRSRRWWARQFTRRARTGRPIAGLCGVWHDLRDEVEGAGLALAGLDGLRRAVDGSRSGLAIGGVTLARIAEIAATGAAGFAAIELFLPASASSSSATLAQDPCVRGRSV